jgi:putative redox protein
LIGRNGDIPEIAVALNLHYILDGGKKITVMSRNIQFSPSVTDDQRERLLQVAKICPVSKILEAGVQMDTTAAGAV